MSIDIKKLQLPEISIKFIKLMDSKRGFQTRLAKAVDKKPNYFSEIKRGKPVNATHLRAAGLLFGIFIVADLMSIDINCKSDFCLNKDTISMTGDIHKLLHMAKEILISDTDHSDSLASNIRSFHRAIQIEKKMSDLENRIKAIEEAEAEKKAAADNLKKSERVHNI